MGRSAIEEKLNHELQLTITSEGQVVYILAEIRKLLELENAQGQYPRCIPRQAGRRFRPRSCCAPS